MDRVGCDFFVDVHADEELPYNFVSGSEGCPAYSLPGSVLPQLQKDFCRLYEHFNKDFQSVKGYDIDEPNKANLSICSNQIGERFNCLSNTLEMPFKDTTAADGSQEDPARGWSIARCQKLGEDILPVILALEPTLR
jgi:hypothetical protein